MDGTEFKEEQIEDVAHTYDDSDENNLTELAFEEPIIHNYEARNGSSYASENFAVCHFFYPENGSFSERKTSQDQVDPLALNTDGCVHKAESMSIDDELLALETLQTTQLSSFSIIDPLNITEPNICDFKVKLELQDVAEVKPNTESRKIKCFEENQFQEENPKDHEISLKKAFVHIGPKLPLPMCLQSKEFDNVWNVSLTTKKLSRSLSVEADQQTLNKNNHIVFKIYTCSKCHLKHSDSALHKAHVAACVSTPTCDISTSELSSYKDRNGMFSCEFCKFKFRFEKNLISHQNKHVTTKGFTCCVCSMELVSVKKLQNHYYNFHKNQPKLFVCNLCEYSNVTAERLKYHMIFHNSDKHLYCYKCKQNYDENDFDKHPCRCLKKICSKRKTFPQVHKSGGQQSTKLKLSSVDLTNLKLKFESEVIKVNDTYYCNGCSYKFFKYECLVEHKKEHLKLKPYKCYVCEYESFSVVDMGKHIQCHLSQEVKSVSVKCNACCMKFDKWQFLRRHAVFHVYDELYCSSCRVNFEDSESLIQHMSSSHKQSIKDKMFSCSKCSFTHLVPRSLKRHMSLHLQKENKIIPVNSKGAMQVNDSNVRLESEKIGSIKTTSSFKCTSCRIRFKNPEVFEKHKKNHLSESTLISSDQGEKDIQQILFKCYMCSYECSDINSFTDHVKFNHSKKEKPFTCLVCDQKMASLISYLLHLKSHSQVPTYCCPYCKYHTRKENSFTQHYNKHNLKCCPMCIYSTHSFQALKDHVNRQHKPRNGQALFVCTLCPYSSSNEKFLSVHSLKFHPKEYPSLKLPVPNYLKKTLKNHEDKLNACGLCQFTNYRIYDFKRHLTRHFKNGQLNVKSLSRGVKNKSLPLKTAYHSKLNKCSNAALKNSVSLFHYACSQCSFKSKGRSSVSCHLRSIHNVKGGVRNNMILKLNSPLFSNAQNTKLKTKKVVLRCTDCEVEQFSFRAQTQHRRLGHKAFWRRAFSCPKCSSRFNTEMYLGKHECKKRKLPLDSKILCKTAGFEQNINKHKHSHICAKPSTTRKAMSKSPKTHIQQNLKRNMSNMTEDEEQLSSGDESFSCGECNFVTSDVTDLINHMFIHSGVLDD